MWRCFPHTIAVGRLSFPLSFSTKTKGKNNMYKRYVISFEVSIVESKLSCAKFVRLYLKMACEFVFPGAID